ncbi:hypothetical protein TGRUB_362090 [Toxoplasma gondii RUB]|uniref:Uncharacterized protein n=4 Tax=Toxoplasma gondii TaxID=5811 RepID=S7UY24_TOXGG|nr:hypothetical protein TGGT1_362090 [Toxoplasma gondii GT1]KAF4640933.1 hypothetical protein TGRH88_067410 [Toxoplasma gondii]KFG65616.1 hypothetical protein TGRUB_362090 [Toxoplasma gondii RUB]RQX71573.1 hypothetical protein TGCAST_362090 [Toxoplasma gondii CAST]
MAPSQQNNPGPFVPADMRLSPASAFIPTSFLGPNKRTHPAAFAESSFEVPESSSAPALPSSFFLSAGEFPRVAEPKRRRLSSQTPAEVSNRRLHSVTSSDDCLVNAASGAFDCGTGAAACFSPQRVAASFPPLPEAAFSSHASRDVARDYPRQPPSLLSHLSRGNVTSAFSAALQAGGGPDNAHIHCNREARQFDESAEMLETPEENCAPTLLPRRPRCAGGGKAAAEMFRAYDLFYM